MNPEMTLSTQALITANLAQLLKRPAGSLAADISFADLGLDSLGGVRLTGMLEEQLGREIDPVLVLDHPSIAELAAQLDAVDKGA